MIAFAACCFAVCWTVGYCLSPGAATCPYIWFVWLDYPFNHLGQIIAASGVRPSHLDMQQCQAGQAEGFMHVGYVWSSSIELCSAARSFHGVIWLCCSWV